MERQTMAAEPPPPPADMLLQLPDEMLITILNLLSMEEFARMNSVSKRFQELCSLSPLPVLMFESPTLKLSFEIRMQNFPNMMFESPDKGLCFVNAMGSFPGLMSESPKPASSLFDPLEDFPTNLSDVVRDSFLDLMFGSRELKSLFVDADMIFQSSEPIKPFRYLKFESAKTVSGSRELKSLFVDADMIFESSEPIKPFRYLKFESAKTVLPLVSSSSSSSLELHREHLNINKLRLRLDYRYTRETGSIVDSLIEEALERKVQELDLQLIYHKLPCKVFIATTIRVLKLKNCEFEINGGGIDMPELRELHLESLRCDQQSVQRLLSCCPLIERLRLIGLSSTSLHVCGLPRLGKLELYFCLDLISLEIDAPGLRRLVFSSPVRSEVVLRNLEFLKELELKDKGIGEDMLKSFLPNLPSLEQLKINNTELQSLEISHSRLKLLELSLSWGQKQTYVELDTPNLKSFLYSGYRMPLAHAMKFINFASLQEVAISMQYEVYKHYGNIFSSQEYQDYYNIFISNLKGFLDKLKHCRVIKLTIEPEEGDFSLRDQILLVKEYIKHLTLKVKE